MEKEKLKNNIDNQIEELKNSILDTNDWKHLNSKLIEIMNKVYSCDNKKNMLIKTYQILKWAREQIKED